MPTDTDIEREFADLVETLREDRMEIDPFFARELDAKVATGFPREPRWRRFFKAHRMLIPGVATSMLLLVVAGAMIRSIPGDDSAESGSSAAGGMSPALVVPETADDAGDVENSSGGSATPQMSKASRPRRQSAPAPGAGGGSPRSDNRRGRLIETSASVILGAKPGGVETVTKRVIEIVDNHRGFVLSSSMEVMAGGGGATLELRVRSDRLQDVLRDLSRIADVEVRERREAAQDITREFVSARSRLADARAERKGLLRQLARVITDAERESIKLQLRDVGARISAAKTDLARVNNRASYSNVSVSVVGDPAASAGQDDGSWTPGDAARDAVRVLEVAVGVLLIALAVGLPLALLAALALLLARLTQRRRRERLLDAV